MWSTSIPDQGVRNLRLSGSLDTYIPVYIGWQGGRLAEVEVTQLPRSHGFTARESPAKRTLKTLLDLVFLKFMQRYSTKPLYVFGTLGVLSLLGGVVSFSIAVVFKFSGHASFISTPLPLLTALFVLTGILLLTLGIMAEFLTRIYQLQSGSELYNIAEFRNNDTE